MMKMDYQLQVKERSQNGVKCHEISKITWFITNIKL